MLSVYTSAYPLLLFKLWNAIPHLWLKTKLIYSVSKSPNSTTIYLPRCESPADAAPADAAPRSSKAFTVLHTSTVLLKPDHWLTLSLNRERNGIRKSQNRWLFHAEIISLSFCSPLPESLLAVFILQWLESGGQPEDGHRERRIAVQG